MRDHNERIVYWFVLERDFEDRKRSEALSAGEKRVLDRVAQGEPLTVVLNALCRLVEGIAEPCWCSILLIDPSGTAFLYGAAPTLPRDYNEVKPQVGKLTDFKSGPCGLAASTKQPVIVPDLAEKTRWDENGWRTLALKHGLRSIWTSPILSRTEKVIGTFAIYHRASGSPSQFQRDLIGRLTHIASIAIERAKAEEALGKVRADLMHMTSVMSLSASTALIAHEVNQPLSGVVTTASTCLRMLSAEPPNVEGASETARRMIRDGHRAADVIQRLRDLFSKKGPVSQPLDLNDATHVSRSIIESHEGQIWATQNEGPGETFSFSIPLTPKNNGATA